MLIAINIASFSLVAVLLTAFIKKSVIKWLACIFFSFILSLQIISLTAGGTLVDYRFFIHANVNDVRSFHTLFDNGLILILIILLLNTLLIYLGSNLVKKIKLFKNKYALIAFSLLFAGIMCLKNGIIYNAGKIYSIRFAHFNSFEKCITKLGLHDYVQSRDIKAVAGKNIIVISLESYEKAYLHPSFEHLTPFLSSLKNKWSFLPIVPHEGSNWTSGSLYTYLTGFPAYFSGNGNLFFQQSESTRIASISHILKAAGYSTTYLCGNNEFSGTEDLLKTMGFDSIIDYRNLNSKYHTNPSFGLHDLDLFTESKLRLSQLKKTEKPFALFMSTISTHHPNGIYDERMKDKVRQSGSDLEFMVAAVDDMMQDLIDFLKTEGMLDNTAIFIFPDHLKMGSGSAFKHTGKRELFLLANTNFKQLIANTRSPLFQIDLPRLIINGAGIRSNAVFLSDRISFDKNTFLLEKQKDVASLNTSGLVRKNIWNGTLTIQKSSPKQFEIQLSHSIITIFTDSLIKHNFILNFSPEMRLKQSGYVLKGNFPARGRNDIQIKVSYKNERIYSELIKEGFQSISKNHSKKINFDASETNELIASKNKKHLQLLWKTNMQENIIGIKNTSYKEVTYTINEEIPQSIVAITYSNSAGAKPFLILFNQPYAPSRVLLHEALPDASSLSTFSLAVNQFVDEPCLIIRNWADTGAFFVKSIEINEKAMPQKSKLKSLYLTDSQRFIAHAGGSINGKVYTNSLEALEVNYKKGFRLFELDIVETLDGHFVAAHDWEYWKKISGYKGSIPVTEKKFKEQKLFGMYKPLGMAEINQWFKEHQDAILVTDKVNKPKAFSELFVDKNRLMMEVFSMIDYEQAKKAGIRAALVSENILNEMQGDIASDFVKKGVTHVAISRQSIEFRKNLLKQLKNNNIKVYVFHVNFEEGKDEEHVLDYELDHVYGMYADYWPANP